MADLPLLFFNFSLGVLAFFSPCGIPMLPAYLAYYLPRADREEGFGVSVARGLGGGALAALGGFLVLAAIGLLAALLGAPFKERVILLELVGGLVVIALGVLTLLGRGPRVALAVRPSEKRSALALVGFGALYAGVSAGCAAPVFLSMLFGAFAAPTLADAALQVGAYAAGLAALLLAVTVLVTTTQDAMLKAMRRALPHVERASGVVLILVGLYLVHYWARVEFGLPALGLP